MLNIFQLRRGYVFVQRFGRFTPETVVRQLRWLSKLNEPLLLHIFPEGTRVLRLIIGLA